MARARLPTLRAAAVLLLLALAVGRVSCQDSPAPPPGEAQPAPAPPPPDRVQAQANEPSPAPASSPAATSPSPAASPPPADSPSPTASPSPSPAASPSPPPPPPVAVSSPPPVAGSPPPASSPPAGSPPPPPADASPPPAPAAGSPPPPPPSNSPPPGPSNGSSGGGLSTGAIIGIAAGGGAALVVAVLAVALYLGKRRKPQPPPPSGKPGAAATAYTAAGRPGGGGWQQQQAPPRGGGPGSGPAGYAQQQQQQQQQRRQGSSPTTPVSEDSAEDDVAMMRMEAGAGLMTAAELAAAQRALASDPVLTWVKSTIPAEQLAGPGAGVAPAALAGGAAAGGAAAAAAARRRERQLSEVGGSGAGSGASTPSSARLQGRTGSASRDLSSWQVRFNDLQMQRPIGEGSFGKVYLARWNETLVAAKILITPEEATKGSEASLPPALLDGLIKEAALMASLRHPNVVAFMGVCQYPPCVVTEYCGKGSLTDVLRSAKRDPTKAAQLTWPRRLNMALDAAKGMLYLHSREPAIIHRDLKSPNLLVDSHWRVKVSDFNLSKLMEESAVATGAASTLGVMNPRWLAPELLQGEKASQSSDVYAFGMVLWELLTWELPWEGQNPWQLVGLIVNGGRLPIPARRDLPGPDTMTFAGLDGYVALLKQCWAQNELDRPTFAEIIPQLRRLLEGSVGEGRGSPGTAAPASRAGSLGNASPPGTGSADASAASLTAAGGSKQDARSLATASGNSMTTAAGNSRVPAAAGSMAGPATPPTGEPVGVASPEASAQALDGAAPAGQQQPGQPVYRTTSEAWAAIFGGKAE